MEGRTVSQEWDRRHLNNPYTNARTPQNRPTSQEPDRMYRAPRERTREEINYGREIPTPEEIDRVLKLDQIGSTTADLILEQQRSTASSRRKIGLGLQYRHRYGDEIDILKAKFTKTKKELEDEKFRLIISCRQLNDKIFYLLLGVPKHEKFVLSSEIRSHAYELLKLSVAIKKRYYRKNMLETMDITLEVLRELFRHANRHYTQWINDDRLSNILEAINVVGRIVHGLLCTTVV